MGLIIGIDPGQKGAIAMLDTASGEAWVCAMPVRGKPAQPDVQAIDEWARAVGGQTSLGYAFAIVEAQSTRPNMKGANALMTGYGRLLGWLDIRQVAYDTVSPRKWQGVFGIAGDDTKAQSIDKARRLFPTVDIGKHHGIADALLIAEYARRLKG